MDNHPPETPTPLAGPPTDDPSDAVAAGGATLGAPETEPAAAVPATTDHATTDHAPANRATSDADASPVTELPIEATGEPLVDAALDRVRAIPGLPLDEHVGAFEHAHRGLQDALATLDRS